MTLVIGLTGGIASGKSTVAQLFADKGITVIDTDQIARDIVAPHSDALHAIVEHFGKSMLTPQGHLDRRALRTRIFNHTEDKAWLEALLHPRIRAITNEQIAHATSPYCIVVIPLLVETAPNPLIQRILLVDTSTDTQVARLMARDALTKEDALKMIAQQATREARLNRADDVIHNDHHPEHLQACVNRLHTGYLAL